MQKYEFRMVINALYRILNDKDDANREEKALEILEDALEQTENTSGNAKKRTANKEDPK